MNVTTTYHDDHTHIALEGELDARTSPQATQAVLDAMREGGTSRVLLDLAAVSFMSSPGLRMLLAIYKQGQASGVRVDVANPQPGVKRVLTIAGFDKMVTIITEED